MMPVDQPGTVCGPASSSTVTAGPAVNSGASFTGMTVTVKANGALVFWPPLSVPPVSTSVTRTAEARWRPGPG